MTALQVLIPSLLPIWLTSRNGMLVDFGAHLGGAVGGALVAGLLLAMWPRSSPMPRFRYVAIALAGAGLLGSLAALIPISGSYALFQQEEAQQARLIPASQFRLQPRPGERRRIRWCHAIRRTHVDICFAV
jgi:hypothetical protein